jgi:hypothetical protein
MLNPPEDSVNGLSEDCFVCVECGAAYKVEYDHPGTKHYFEHPYDYASGCKMHCLKCWLGCGPASETLLTR